MGSESSASTGRPRRASSRANVPAMVDLPAPPLPTNAIRIIDADSARAAAEAGSPGSATHKDQFRRPVGDLGEDLAEETKGGTYFGRIVN